MRRHATVFVTDLLNDRQAIGGALGIFAPGWLWGVIAHKSQSVAASVLAHSLNNLLA